MTDIFYSLSDSRGFLCVFYHSSMTSLNFHHGFFPFVPHPQIILVYLVDIRKPVNVKFLDFIKAFDIVSSSIFLEKMSIPQLDKCIVQWVSEWLACGAQRVVVNQTGELSVVWLQRSPSSAQMSSIFS